MNVIRARVLGFCMGVRRAVEMARAELAAGSCPVYSLGPLIHNPHILAALEARGLSVLDGAAVRSLSGAVVIIRAHGASPAVEQSLRGSGARIVDATCPRVRSSQETARRLAAEGRRVFIAGEDNHAEVRGVAGHVEAYGQKPCIAGTASQAGTEALRLKREYPDAACALVAQTTFSPEEYAAVAAAIRQHFPALEVQDTICGATRERQDALRKLCGEVDCVVVAGGKESANTRALAAIARNCGKYTLLAECAADLASNAAALHGKTVGLCAGASTPDTAIDEIEEAVRALHSMPG